MLGDADLRPLLADLKMPVAVVVGEEDYATPVAAAQALQRGIHRRNAENPEGAAYHADRVA